MYILAIETSSRKFSLAVAKDAKILRYGTLSPKKMLSDSLIPSIQNILKKSDASIKAIDGFAVGLGPGYFTSLRVGLSTIKGLAFATNKPVVGIPSLDILAMAADKKAETICSICDAKRDLLYWAVYERKDNQLKRQTDYQLTGIADVLKYCRGETTFIGDGIKLSRDEIEVWDKFKKNKAILSDEKKWYPQAKHLIHLALPRFEKQAYDDSRTLVPLYLYPEDCQVRKH